MGLVPYDRTWVGAAHNLVPFYRSWADAANWPRPAFTPSRTVNVTDQTTLSNAITNMQAGDLIKNTSATGFDVSGEFTISKNPSSTVVIDLGLGAAAVRFNYGGTSNLPSVWLNGCSNLTFYGGVVTNPTGGKGILCYGPASNLHWWDFVVHDCADNGIACFTVGGAWDTSSWRGEVYNCALIHSIDTHSEQGTGQHCMITADSGSGFSFANFKAAIYGHDHNGGSVFECGQPNSDSINGVEVWIKAENLTMAATTQVAGNGINLWGSSTTYNGTVHMLQVKNAQGRALDRSGRQSSSCAGWTVEHGRAVNCCQNQSGMISAGLLNTTNPYDPNYTGPPAYQDCSTV